MKRLLDVVCAAMGLLCLGPLLLVIAIAIWAEDRHSPLFLGRRVARRDCPEDNDSFFMVKFRTMIPDAWRSGVSSTANGDRRITRVGSLLRRAKLDELPELWNVLVGEMSLVGPRPQVEPDVALYTPIERQMLTARPGITDLASIVFSDEGSILAGAADPDLLYNQIIRPWKSRLALLGVERDSAWTSIRIIGLTLVGAVSRERTLRGVQEVLEDWDADPILLEMASRTKPLMAWPPPGAAMVVAHYPNVSATPPETQKSSRATHA